MLHTSDDGDDSLSRIDFCHGLPDKYAERGLAVQNGAADGNAAVRRSDCFGKWHCGDHGVLKGWFGPVSPIRQSSAPGRGRPYLSEVHRPASRRYHGLVRTGASLRLDEYGALGRLAFKAATTLGASYARVERYARLWTSVVEYELRPAKLAIDSEVE